MKKLVTIALLCAMLLSCFAGCAMQKGEIEVDAYAAEANVQDVALTTPTTKPTTGVSQWTGGKISAGTYDNKNVIGQVTGIEVSLNKDDYTKNTTNVAGASIAWFNPAETTHYLNSAADLVGFMTLRLFANDPIFKESYKAIANRDLNSFDAHTFVLTTNVDLNGVEMAVYNSDIKFEGTFDGGNHAIMNFNMKFSSGNKAFFSAIQGDACIKNLSLFDVDGYCVAQSAKAITNCGSLVGNLTTVEGKTAIVSNVYSEAKFTMDGAVNSFSQVGGIIGTINGKGNATIEDCVFGGQIDMRNDAYPSAGQYSGGICRGITGSANVTFTRCSTTADASIIINNTVAAGIVGYVTSTGTTKLVDCVNNADITAKGYTAGMLGHFKNGSLIFERCVNNGNFYNGASGYVAGIVGRTEKAVKLSITECYSAAGVTLNGGVNSAGIVGYIDGAGTDVDIISCNFYGVLVGGRGSGGIAGYVHDENIDFTMTDCTVSGTLNFNATDVKNNSLGGLIGRLNAKTAVISNCEFSGILNANFDPTFKADNNNICAAGGLIGYAFNAVNTTDKVAQMELSLFNNKVSGVLNFTDENRDTVDPVEAAKYRGIYIGYAEDATAKVTYSNLSTGENLNVTGGKALVNMNGADIAVVGYQVKENGDTYNLRYVATVDAPAEDTGIGFIVSIYKKDGGAKVAVQENVVTYAEYIYKTINGGGETYAADDFYADYLYTLEIQGIPAGYSVENGNLEVLITPFTAEDADTLNFGMTADHGKIVIEEPAA